MRSAEFSDAGKETRSPITFTRLAHSYPPRPLTPTENPSSAAPRLVLCLCVCVCVCVYVYVHSLEMASNSSMLLLKAEQTKVKDEIYAYMFIT